MAPKAGTAERVAAWFGRVASRALLATLFLAVARSAGAAPFIVFGPQEFVRSNSGPVTVHSSFNVLDPSAPYTIDVQNDGVSSAVITINGVVVVSPSDLNQQVTHLSRAVTLQSANDLAVEVRSTPGNRVTITIRGVDHAAPTSTPTSTPGPNAKRRNTSAVTVSFTCSDSTSGIASCPPPVTVTAEGAGQSVSGTATDKAGNSSSTSVTLNIDKTQPTVAITAPTD